MPSGLARLRYKIKVQTEVFDVLLASTIARVDLTVQKPLSSGDIDYMWNLLRKANNGREDKDSLKWALGMGLSILNVVNCTNAPNCSALNRRECSLIDNTCGLCISDQFVGEVKHANSICTPPNLNASIDVPKAVKQCPNNCTQNGHCTISTIIDGARKYVSSCPIDDDFCTASCLCSVGFSGLSCSFEDDVLLSKQVYRANLLSQMGKLFEQEDLDKQSIKSMTTLITNIASASDELSDVGTGKLFGVSHSILSSSIELKIPSESIRDVAQAIDVMMPEDVTHNGSSSVTKETIASVQELIGLYSKAMSNNMVIGEFGGDSILESIRISIAKVDLSAENELKSAVSAAEKAMDSDEFSIAKVHLNRVTFDYGEANATASRRALGEKDVDTSMGVSVVQFSRTRYGNNAALVGNPIQLFYDRDPCANVPNKNDCFVTISLPYRTSGSVQLAQDVTSAQEGLEYNCTMGPEETTAHRCSDTGDVLTASCNGTWAGTIRLWCPVSAVYPSCDIVASQTGAADEDLRCSTISYTKITVTCRCPMASLAFIVTDGNGGAHSVSPQFVPLLKQTVMQFQNTWMDADAINGDSIQDGYVALATIGIVCALGAVLLYVSVHLDREETSKHSKLAPATTTIDVQGHGREHSWLVKNY